MRPTTLLILMAATGLPAAGDDVAPDLRPALAAADTNERYRLALAALRAAGDGAVRFARHPDRRVAEAAIDAARERLAESAAEPNPAAERLAERLLALAGAKESDPDLARRAAHAVAEARQPFGGRVSGAMARLALDPACRIRSEAITALAALGDGTQVATLARLAGDADPTVAETAQAGLVATRGRGVTDSFLRGIADPELGTRARSALLRAAAQRGMVAAVPAAATAVGEPTLRLEAQKALLKLARKEHLGALREARAGLGQADATRAALDRLIARLEKAGGA